MPRKLTVLGALVAVVLGVMGVVRGNGASVDAAPIQPFTPDVTQCFGGSYPTSLACGAGSSDTAISGASVGLPIVSYTIIALPEGSRLTLPITFTPDDFGFDQNGSANGPECQDDDDDVDPSIEAISCVVGNVTSRTDLLCDDLQDILADATSPKVGAWPNETQWIPFDFGHMYDSDEEAALAADARNSYLLDIKPMPASYDFVSMDKAPLHNLFFGGGAPFPLNPPTPLSLVTESTTQGTGFRVSAALLAGNPNNPPNTQMLCLDSPQDSITENEQTIVPASTGLYPRWTILTSNPDAVEGTVDRILDWECVNVGAVGGDSDSDCLADGSEPVGCVGALDCDGDLLPDGIERVFGSDIENAGDDADPSPSESGGGDNADDYDEMFQLTSPTSNDTDGDGSEDVQDNGSDENGATAGFIDSTNDDNCPTDAASEDATTNEDSEDDLTGTPPPDGQKDITNGNEDVDGNACDADDDNDGMTDAAEGALHIKTSGVPAANVSFCTGSPTDSGAPAPAPTDPADPDDDDDLGFDGRECVFESNPQNGLSRMAANSGADADLLSEEGGSGGAFGVGGETFYRTQNFSQTGGTPEDDPDGDAVTVVACAGDTAGRCDNDSDNDKVQDGLEVKFYATHPANADTDADGCSDGKEAASINNDRTVSSTDLGQTAQRFGLYRDNTTGAVNSLVKVNYDYTKDANISAADLGQIAQNFGGCASNFETGLSVSGRSTQN